MPKVPKLAPPRFDTLFLGAVAVGSLCLIAQFILLIGVLVKGDSASWERVVAAETESLARDLEAEARLGPRVTPGTGQATPWAARATDWQEFDRRLTRIESQVPPTGNEGVDLSPVRGLIWEVRDHELDLLAQTDPVLQKGLVAKWYAALALAQAKLQTAAASLKAAPSQDPAQTRTLRIRDLALGNFGILSLAAALLWRLVLSPGNTSAGTDAAAAAERFGMAAYRLSRDAILIVDREGKVRAMNAASENLLGGPAPSYLGKPLDGIVSVPAGDVLEPVATQATHETGATVPVEMIYRRLRGRSSKSSIVILRPQPEALVPSPRQPKPLAAMPASKADSTLLADLLMLCPAPLLVLDPGGRIAHFNRACFEATGYQIEEVRNRPYWEVALRGNAAEQERKRWESGEPRLRSRVSVQQWWTERGPVNFDWSWSVFLDPTGAPQLIIAIGVELQKPGGTGRPSLPAS